MDVLFQVASALWLFDTDSCRSASEPQPTRPPLPRLAASATKSREPRIGSAAGTARRLKSALRDAVCLMIRSDAASVPRCCLVYASPRVGAQRDLVLPANSLFVIL